MNVMLINTEARFQEIHSSARERFSGNFFYRKLTIGKQLRRIMTRIVSKNE